MREESAVEPTRSLNITVTWRRSARSSGVTVGRAASVPALRKLAIASRSLRRCPTAVTPSSFRVSCVRLGRTVSSISFSRNPGSYFSRPRLRSQSPISISWAPSLPSGRHHRPWATTCLGRPAIVLFWRVVKGDHGDPKVHGEHQFENASRRSAQMTLHLTEFQRPAGSRRPV